MTSKDERDQLRAILEQMALDNARRTKLAHMTLLVGVHEAKKQG